MTDEYVWVFIKPGTRDTACIPASVMTEKKQNWFVVLMALLQILSHTIH